MEKIIAITDYSGKMGGTESYSNFGDGYKIITDKQEITMLISNSQSCCENWGYFFCNDDPQEFVGAVLREVKLTDGALNQAHMKDNDVESIYDGSIMFVNFETDKGTLQFVAYNEHNGYYSHEAIVRCTQLNHEEYL